MNNIQNNNHIIEGEILSSLLKLSIPTILAQLMQTVYNLADTLWLGRFGANAVAAISVGFPLVFLLISFAGGITLAGTTLVAQYKGAGDQEMVNKTASQLLSFLLLISFGIMVIGLLFNKDFLILMGTPNDILNDAVGYLNIIFMGLPLIFMSFIFSSTLRGSGNTVTPMKLMIMSVIINIILDPFLIFGWSIFPELGVKGAAIATVFSRLISSSVALYYLVKGNKGIKLRVKYMIPTLAFIKKVTYLGMPSAIEQSARSIGQIVMTGIVTGYGSLAVAAFGIGNRILSVAILPTRGFSSGATTMVGQNLGANQEARADKSGLISVGINSVGMILLGIVVYFFSGDIIQIFNDNSEVVLIGSEYLKFLSFSFIFIGTMFIVNGIFRGAGNTVLPMVFSLVSLLVLRVPLATILAKFKFGLSGVWWAILISNLVSGLVAFIWFLVGDWKKEVIDKKEVEIEDSIDNDKLKIDLV
ncbi:MATE family efflux transporter [Selenihalanaerobacter shriftii]|uniref:Probable multidrug resistance protein NorM n=1 Tax=Selenihalanaerobacter shriftii TaxID=142842 RepID=A0A1T4K4Y1_9FIRM|nr:MATE family efflux transporter [Selenihalanaerobacter shriftii]SJZ37462.1 putative efflux protein, MATE family [Selenihalanaerobacter shriftii]